jgi:hypothetical protein
MGERLGATVLALAEATRWMNSALTDNPEAALAGATPYLRLFGLAAGGVYLARGALLATRDANAAGLSAHSAVALARFFAEQLTPVAPGLADTITTGADATFTLSPEALAG